MIRVNDFMQNYINFNEKFEPTIGNACLNRVYMKFFREKIKQK